MKRIEQQIVAAVLEDLSDRRGIRQSLESIDAEIHEQMIRELETVVFKVLAQNKLV